MLNNWVVGWMDGCEFWQITVWQWKWGEKEHTNTTNTHTGYPDEKTEGLSNFISKLLLNIWHWLDTGRWWLWTNNSGCPHGVYFPMGGVQTIN